MSSRAETPFLGLEFNNIDFNDLCREIDDAKRFKRTLSMMSLNLDILTKIHKDPRFREASSHFSLILVDSTPLLKIMESQKIQVKEKLAGSDIMPRVCQFAAVSNYSCFILGGAEGVPERAARHLQAANPGLQIAGTLSPEYGFHNNPDRCIEITELIKDSGADIVFICLGAPKAEFFIDHYLQDQGITAIFSVGAAVDFCAGTKRRAPRWIQKSGLEWLFRFAQEPRRLFKRYFIDSWAFLSIYLRYRSYGEAS